MAGSIKVECPYCKGQGRTKEYGHCFLCAGTGKVIMPKGVDLKSPGRTSEHNNATDTQKA